MTEDQRKTYDERRQDIALENRKWFYRRKIAFLSLRAGIAILLLAIGASVLDSDAAERVADISDIIVWGISGLISLTGIYMGVATWQDIKKLK